MGRRTRLKNLTKSWAGRTLQNGKVAATLAGAAVRHVAGKPEGALLGERLEQQLGSMKGLAMKVGQMASYMDGLLPPEAAERLQKLQANSEPMDPETLVAILEASLGTVITEAFTTFDMDPVAAASIGQVHRATRGDQDLAVKIQYPGVRETLDIDMKNLLRLGGLASLGMQADAKAIIRELHDRFLEECDYENESRNQHIARNLLADNPRVWVPLVLESHSSDIVLTSEWAESESLQDFAANSTQEERDQVGAALFHTVFSLIFEHGWFNADPQPGNFRVTADRRIVLLDWGCVCTFDTEQMLAWKQLAWATLEDRKEDLPAALWRCGFVEEGQDYDYDQHWEMMEYLYRPFKSEGFVYSAAYVEESIALFGPDNPNLRRMNLPPEWVLVNRLQWGLNSILAMLGSRGDWNALFTDALSRDLRLQRP